MHHTFNQIISQDDVVLKLGAEVVALIEEVAAEMLGADHVGTPKPEMGAEDYGAFLELAPGAMFLLGCLVEGDERYHHHPRFDIDEECLPIGVAILTEATLRLLRADAG